MFNLLGTIDRKAIEYHKLNGCKPASVSISPNSYRWLLELKAQENAIGNLVICCSPLTHVLTSAGKQSIVIDEMCPDTRLI
jgi:hypothetical protein